MRNDNTLYFAVVVDWLAVKIKTTNHVLDGFSANYLLQVDNGQVFLLFKLNSYK